MRSSGLNIIILLMMSRACGLVAGGNREEKGGGAETCMLEISVSISSLSMKRRSASGGRPSLDRMTCSWCCGFFPRKRGSWRITSAKMQPTPQTSTALPYMAHSSSSSGGRYQRVTTYSVSMSTPASKPRARPKSHSARSQLAFTSRLEGFRSRCSTLAECTYFRPRRIWNRKYCRCWSVSTWRERMMRSRSLSIRLVTM
mmetsp:Transcript_14334/g.32200  ORF Transcript_14334/g.32200 Transcript_14334/m.32200 type:complete len:200 (+) Transcript_14334:435-1034(+)